jgi:hypothetical protein
MDHPCVAIGLQTPLNTPHLAYAPLQQPRRLGLATLALQHRGHDLQPIPLTLTHLDLVSIHPPLLGMRTLLLW